MLVAKAIVAVAAVVVVETVVDVHTGNAVVEAQISVAVAAVVG